MDLASERLSYLPRSDAAGQPLPAATALTRAEAWPLWAVLTLFWAYVALSNILYARSMSLALDPEGVKHYFASWDARVIQHLFLYPALLGAIWLSLRLGWRPAWRAVPLQLLLALLFAVPGTPLLDLSEWIVKGHATTLGMTMNHDGGSWWTDMTGHDLPLWTASITGFVLAYGFALALTTGVRLYQNYRDSQLRLAALERAWSGARLAALRMQLSPHTLFNLLHTIRGQIGWNPGAAQSMIVQLGDLLRRLLAAGERDFCPLTEELQFACLYLELQQKRFADRLRLSFPDTARVPAVWVPSLILQPLIENAVVHGLAAHCGAVEIELQALVEHDRTVLRVTNTMAAERAIGSDGIGLRNVRERLNVHFGERAELEAGPAGARHWAVTVRLPRIDAAR